MRSLCVRRQVHIHGGKQDPLAIGRGHRLLHPLELHHVFEGEGMFFLCEQGNASNEREKSSYNAAHTSSFPSDGQVYSYTCHVERSRNTDRKSTRLNSSHGYISYAVFCLNK